MSSGEAQVVFKSFLFIQVSFYLWSLHFYKTLLSLHDFIFLKASIFK